MDSTRARHALVATLTLLTSIALTMSIAASVEAGAVTRVRDIRLGPSGSKPEWLTAVGNSVFFTAYKPKRGRELWKSDGTRRGTRIVKDIRRGPELWMWTPGRAN